MADKKPKRPTFSTPVGIASYPHLNTPDTRFSDGDYKCNVRLKADDAAPFIAELEAIRDAFFDEQDAKVRKTHSKAAVFTVELDDEGNETGFVIIKTKLNAHGKNKTTGETWENEPKLFDADGEPMPKSVQIWSGSKVIVAGTVNTYCMAKEKSIGVTLKCRGVQVLKLITKGDSTAESFGFKKQEGYKAPSAKNAAADEDDRDDDTDAPAKSAPKGADDGEF